jgi:hypothetical protein
MNQPITARAMKTGNREIHPAGALGGGNCVAFVPRRVFVGVTSMALVSSEAGARKRWSPP